ALWQLKEHEASTIMQDHALTCPHTRCFAWIDVLSLVAGTSARVCNSRCTGCQPVDCVRTAVPAHWHVGMQGARHKKEDTRSTTSRMPATYWTFALVTSVR